MDDTETQPLNPHGSASPNPFIAEGQRSSDPVLLTKDDRVVKFTPETPPEPDNATTRLRAYEDELFGKDAVRLRGQVERGFGSKHKEMTGGQRRHYEALERAIVTEQALADAETKLIDAKAAHEAASKEVADSQGDAHAIASE
jgi:hypothetical protein